MPNTIDHIKRSLTGGGAPSSDFDLNPEITLPSGRILRSAAVLVPLIWQNDEWHVILTMRSSALKHHPGQIAFPGGKQDDGDSTLIETALREAEEEIGLPRECVEILGSMASHETVTGFVVTPIVGVLRTDFDVCPESGEVAEVFSVPLTFLADNKNFEIQSRRWRGKRRYYYVVPYGPYYIWGATARMLRAFADTLAT
ncbi:CoA pyrophosphatase [Planktotalea sp.]|uniref:CoA pyrophosphatase n=1 Tax=Planktotalea sp. TaxID=2029877 RepID=UPI0025D43D4F|nr:CoA pyrophosphatase [Planktotalea sp.]